MKKFATDTGEPSNATAEVYNWVYRSASGIPAQATEGRIHSVAHPACSPASARGLVFNGSRDHVPAVTTTAAAIDEHGVLRPHAPLPLTEGACVG